jgi:pimeloyl-ACP methyl ester carboxylesterase
MWRKIIPGLADRYRVVAPDLRGLGDSARPVGGYDKKTMANDVWRLVHDVLGETRFFLVGHDWGGPIAFALAAQHRDAVRRLAIFDVPVPGDGTPVMFNNRWHHGLHWELDFPEALTAGREDLYLGFFYRNWGARPDAISEEDQREYLRTYRQPGAMRAGFNLYRATPQDVEDNQRFLAAGKLAIPVLCYGGPGGDRHAQPSPRARPRAPVHRRTPAVPSALPVQRPHSCRCARSNALTSSNPISRLIAWKS